MHLFCKSQEVFYINFFSVIQHSLACKTAENLMLVGADEFHICTGSSVYNGNEVHFEAPVIAGKGPR